MDVESVEARISTPVEALNDLHDPRALWDDRGGTYWWYGGKVFVSAPASLVFRISKYK